MRLTYITPGNIPNKWANSTHTTKMAQAFKRIGLDVRLVSACFLNEWFKDISEEVWCRYGISTPYKFSRLPLQLLVKIEAKRNLGRLSFGYFSALLSKYNKTDAVYARDYLSPFWSTVMGIPTISEMHSDPSENYQKQKLFKATKMSSYKCLVTISGELAEKYIMAGVPENKIVVEQDGVDLSVYSSISNEDVKKTRKDLLDGRRAIALYAGNLWDYKGMPLIMDAARKLTDISFVLIGGMDEDIKRIKHEAEKLGLNNLNLVGFISHFKVPVYLKAADILLLPNSAKHIQSSTTSPIKLFEYMASGRPIVATSIKNVLNVLSDDYNAVLCSPDDSQGFTKCINDLLSNKNKAVQLAERAQDEVRKYEWTERCKRILMAAGF